MLKFYLVGSLFFLNLCPNVGWAQETAPVPEAPYPGAQTEPDPEEVTLQPIKASKSAKKSEAEGDDQTGEIIEGNKFRGTRKIKHPSTKQGLFRITAKGEYLYKTKPSAQNNAVAARFGQYNPTNLTNADNGTSFNSIYSEASPFIALFDYEWKKLSGFGKFSIRAGTGIFVASGNGRFADDLTQASEVYTLTMLPNSVSAVLYLQFWDRQPLIPYAEGGVDAYIFNEYRDDGKPPFGRFGGSLAAHGAGGLLLPLNFMDRLGMIRLDQDYGINNIYLSVEYRVVTALAGSFDFSANYFNAGFLVEF